LDPYAQEFQALDGVEKGYGHILGCFFLVVVVVVVRSLNGGDTVEPANCPIKCQISQALPNCVCVCVLVTRQKKGFPGATTKNSEVFCRKSNFIGLFLGPWVAVYSGNCPFFGRISSCERGNIQKCLRSLKIEVVLVPYSG